MTTPYDRPSDPAKRHSAALTDGPDRAAARVDAEGRSASPTTTWRSPIVGVATTWIETMPCNFNQRELAQRVKDGIRAAGGTPMEFNTISVSDGVSMGTEGMRASLISREVIADSIELVARGHLFDGLVCLVGCDKTIPARRWRWRGSTPRARALQRLDRPRHASAAATSPSRTCSRPSAPTPPARSTPRSCTRWRSAACPGAGACGGQFTANTMSMALEFLGISPAGLNGIPALNRGKGDAAEECGRLVDAARARGHPPVAHHHPRGDRERRRVGGRRPAARPTACCTCWRSPASWTSRSRSTTSTRIAGRTPIVASLKPGGKFVATDLFDAGGVALVARELKKRELVHAGATHRRRPHPGRDRRPGGRDARPAGRRADRHARSSPPAAWRSCAATSRRTAVSSSWPATSACTTAGRRACSTPRRTASRRSRRASIEPGDVVVIRYEGPAGGPGHARDAARHRGDRGRGARRRGGADHRRPLLGRHPRPDGRARHAGGGPRRPDRGRPRRRHDRVRRRGPRAARASSPTTRSPPACATGRRRRRATRRACSPSTRRSCRSASEGAVTRP